MAYELLQGIDTPKDPNTGGVSVLDTDHAEAHAGRGFVASGSLTVGIGAVGSIQLTVPNPAAATVTVDMTNANADMTYTANTTGSGGNDISVVHVDPSGNDKPLTVELVGNKITISLKTGSAGAIESTATEVAAAVNAHAEISRVLTASVEGTGAGVVNAKAEESLAGGVDKIEARLAAVYVAVTKGEMTAVFKEDASFSASGSAYVPINRNRLSSNKSQITAKTNAATTVVDGSDKVDIYTAVLGAATAGLYKISGEGRGILARNKNYLLQVTNSSGSEEKVGFFIEWSELADDMFRGF